MAENNEDDSLNSIAVVLKEELPAAPSLSTDVDKHAVGSEEATPGSSVQESDKRVKFDSVDLDDISGSEYTDDDGDDEDDDGDVLAKNEHKRKRLKKKKPKHVAMEDDTSSDEDEKMPVDMNINPVIDTFYLGGSAPPDLVRSSVVNINDCVKDLISLQPDCQL